MTDIMIIANVKGHSAAAMIRDVDLAWMWLEPGHKPIEDNTLPRRVHEIQITNDFGTFRQIDPAPEVRLTLFQRMARRWR